MNDQEEEETSVQTHVWCYRRKEEYSEMIKCESRICEMDCFHTNCLNITCIPKVNGYALNARRKQLIAKEGKIVTC